LKVKVACGAEEFSPTERDNGEEEFRIDVMVSGDWRAYVRGIDCARALNLKP
jgi:hypothetical protein